MFETEIKAGAKLLDEEMSGWELKIEIGDLKMESCHTCVLGQVFMDKMTGYWDSDSSYEFALCKLGIDDDESIYGFDLPPWAREALRATPLEKADELRTMFFVQLGDEWGEFIKKRLDAGIDLS